ncbi:MAG: bifunctional 2-C-methyl-D-erythritol 4-phosphate cytidylyltransferase/2-C-methyl-D-erythritol 2,4-cyclodiphosphate synthase [Micropepsaceae bacterium]
MNSPKVTVILVAAGSGVRAGDGLPKQYRPIFGRSVLQRAIDGLRAALPGASMITVIAMGAEALYEAATDAGRPRAITGGETRQASVLRGLEALESDAPDIVLIHDAARPFGMEAVAGALITKVKAGAAAVAPGLEVTDTLRRSKDGAFEPLSRDGIWRVQTPQAFRYADILAAHRAASGQSLTDDLTVAEAAGHTVTLIPGTPAAFKITTAADFRQAEAAVLTERSDVRTGHGYDVHAFGPGDHVMLCGVRVAHGFSLAGHSDADVGLHALTDAILGTIGAADIGAHFPPGDPRWRGASSDAFLRHAASLVAEKGGVVAHVDVTLVCEAPKVGPHRAAMVERLTDILGLSAGRVSIKATTTEGLGFTGRREGIAAYATATVRLPA